MNCLLLDLYVSLLVLYVHIMFDANGNQADVKLSLFLFHKQTFVTP